MEKDSSQLSRGWFCVMWTDDHLRLLIDERKNRNAEYHNIPGNSRTDFWDNVANKINQEFNTKYTGVQCKGKFQNLVRDYTVSLRKARDFWIIYILSFRVQSAKVVEITYRLCVLYLVTFITRWFVNIWLEIGPGVDPELEYDILRNFVFAFGRDQVGFRFSIET